MMMTNIYWKIMNWCMYNMKIMIIINNNNE